ncbi:MAG: type II toxin-antitoxin system VapC family toxin [Micrococcales bacterium]|nr:type II toxin-antitoxin system VapC family toxin [Micrococcales bacterium]
MTLVYFDTSALLKLCLPEAGGTLAARLWHGADAVLTSRISDVEGRCAIAAGQRAGLIDPDTAAQALEHWQRLWASLHLVEYSQLVALTAAQLTANYALRGGDAIQVASALQLEPAHLIVSSWDRSVSQTAAGLGLTAVPNPAAIGG